MVPKTVRYKSTKIGFLTKYIPVARLVIHIPESLSIKVSGSNDEKIIMETSTFCLCNQIRLLRKIFLSATFYSLNASDAASNTGCVHCYIGTPGHDPDYIVSTLQSTMIANPLVRTWS